MSYEKLVSPASKQQAEIIESSRREPFDSRHSKNSIPGGIAGAITNALPFLRFTGRDLSRDDIEEAHEKFDGPEDHTDLGP
jgi:hypothetical protein